MPRFKLMCMCMWGWGAGVGRGGIEKGRERGRKCPNQKQTKPKCIKSGSLFSQLHSLWNYGQYAKFFGHFIYILKVKKYSEFDYFTLH